jgi:hypothetical protein
MIQEREAEKGSARAMRVHWFLKNKSWPKQKDDGKNDRLKNAPLKGASIGRLRILRDCHFQVAMVDCEGLNTI